MQGAEEVIELLESNRYSFTPEGVRALMEERNLKLEEDFDTLAQVVVEEGLKRMTAPLNKLWDTLGIPSLPELEKSLKDGKTVRVWCVKPLTKGQERVEVSIAGGLGSGPSERVPFPFPDHLPEGLDVTASTGWVTFYTPSGLLATNGRAFFKTNNQSDLEKALETARILRPALSAMGLPDIEEALGELKELKHGEARMEGPYVLARMGSYWVLRRGLVLGDPQLDGALLADEEVGLSSGKVEIAFRFYWWREGANLDYVRFRLGEESIYLWKDGLSTGYSLDLDPVTKVIRSRIERAFEYHERSGGHGSPLKGASPKMLAFLRAFAEYETPLQALVEDKLHPYVTAELFSEIW